ncbi:MAG: TIR domain-containing protein, partial [Planctomycetota bacterium]
MTFDVFISYSRTDRDAVHKVATWLRDQGVNPFLDYWHLPAGKSWLSRLESHLDDCKAVAVLLGPQGIGGWQQREIHAAIDRQTNQGDQGFAVIPVLLPGLDDPALGFLSQNTWVDLRSRLDDPRELERLRQAIVGEPLGATTQDPRHDICPYRGLNPFREEDATFFHGRDAFTKTLLDAVQRKNLVAVVGASGSGKSSVVRAGLVPRLRLDQQGWEILTITPGTEPLQSLITVTSPPSPDLPRAERIANLNNQARLLTTGDVTLAQLSQSIIADQKGTERLLLVVDQWEELYTQTKDDKQRATFLQQILDVTAKSPVTVVLTLRGDFYGRALGDRAFADRLQDAIVNIGPMTRDELRSTIVEPAKHVNLTFQPGLVETILDDVGSEPGNLPLLEYSLTELWKCRDRSGELTLEAYEETGRVKGAIATRADQIYKSMTPEAQAACQRLMIRLVTLGEGREDTRSRLILPESDVTTEEVVRTLSGSEARLLITNTNANEERQLEVSHEALIREWDQLRVWTDKNRDLLRTIERIANAKQDWDKEKDTEAKITRLLPPGRPLEEAKELLLAGDNELIADIRPYIELSIRRDLWRIAEEEERQREELEQERAAARAAKELARIQQEATEQAEKLAESQQEQAEQAENASRRFRAIAGTTILFAIGAMIFGGASYWFREQALEQTQVAEEARAQAEIERDRAEAELDRAQIKESQLLSKLAQEQRERGDAITAILLTLKALPEETREPERPLV